MKKILPLLFLLSTTTLFSQGATFQKIDNYLKDYQSKIPIPGFSIAIIEGDEIVFSKGYGVEKQGIAKKMTPKSSLGIGALGRAFTSVGIMQLVEKGKLDLDAPVIKYLPWFKTANPSFSDQITVRMCLSNTTALPAQSEAVSSLNPNLSLEKFVRSMEGFYVKRKPGLAFEQSDEGYSIAGLIIAELSGLSYSDYVDKFIFTPLKMARTTTNPSEFESLGVLYGHEMGLKNCIPAIQEAIDGNYIPAGSEMKSSVSDYANFLHIFLNEGQFNGQQFLKKESIEEIFKSNISFQGLGTMLGGNGIDIQCGLGWLEMVIENRTIFILVGNTGTTASIAGINRENNQGVVLLFNGDVNRLDRFVYPSLENTANNVIHILNGEKTTDFAVMRFDDPNEDEDYELPKEKWSKYLGKYFPTGRQNPYFKDRNIEVFENEEGQIALKSYKEANLKGHYLLQFTNESRAVLRNISHPREIQFKIFPNGSIGGLFMFGTEFRKRDESLTEHFKTFEIKKEKELISFLLPKNTTSNWDGKQFLAQFPDKKATALKINIETLSNNSFDKIIQQNIDNQSVISKGSQISKNLKGGIWTEQTIFSKTSSGTVQHIIALFQDRTKGKQIQISFSNPYGKFTPDLQEIMMYFQRSITIEG